MHLPTRWMLKVILKWKMVNVLEGEELISYLTKSNHALKDKVKLYYKKCSDLQEKIYEQQDMCYKTVESVRHFYRNMIFFGNSRGAIMVKMATNKI